MTSLLTRIFADCCSGGCVSRRSLPQTPYKSLDKNSTGATAHVSILRKIDFRHACVWIEQRTHAFDHVKANFRDVLCAQPFQNRPALERDRKCTELRDGKFSAARIGELTIDPIFFFHCDGSGTPDRRANISAEDFFQKRNDPMPKPIAKRIEIFVRRVFTKSEPVLPHIAIDLFAPDRKKWPHDC